MFNHRNDSVIPEGRHRESSDSVIPKGSYRESRDSVIPESSYRESSFCSRESTSSDSPPFVSTGTEAIYACLR